MLRHILLLVLALQLSPLWAAEMSNNPAGGAMPAATFSEADHEALRALMVNASTALNNLDTKALGNYLAPNFAVTLADQSVITNLTQLDEFFQKYFVGKDAPLKAITVTPEATVKTIFIDTHTGIVYGTTKDHYTLTDDSSVDLDAHWTATVVKNGGNWLIQTFHSGVNMVDNPIIDKVRQGSLIWAVVSLLVGLLAGVILSRVLRKS